MGKIDWERILPLDNLLNCEHECQKCDDWQECAEFHNNSAVKDCITKLKAAESRGEICVPMTRGELEKEIEKAFDVTNTIKTLVANNLFRTAKEYSKAKVELADALLGRVGRVEEKYHTIKCQCGRETTIHDCVKSVEIKIDKPQARELSGDEDDYRVLHQEEMIRYLDDARNYLIKSIYGK